MKKAIIACAVIVVVAATLLHLLPLSANRHFAVEDIVYTTSSAVDIVDCAGDTDKLSVVCFPLNNLSVDKTFVVAPRFDSSLSSIAFTGGYYENGRLIDDAGIPQEKRNGYVEKLVGDEWVWVDSLGMTEYSDEYPPGMYYAIASPFPYRAIDANETVNVYFGGFEPNVKYRFTYYFRESLTYTPQGYSTGKELYTISHTFMVSTTEDKPFSVTSVGLDSRGFDYNETVSVRVHLASAALPLYADSARAELEKKVGGMWIPMESERGYGGSAVRITWEGDPDRYVPVLEPGGIGTYGRTLYVDDVESEYRLTLFFTENPDGSGERYTLRLRLRFSGE